MKWGVVMGAQKISINVAATQVGTEVLGPGVRSVVWVQGCPFRCRGCISPAWQPVKPARLVHPVGLAEELLSKPEVTGLTISGGEPMVQAAALAKMIKVARRMRDLDVICFTGFQLKDLIRFSNRGINELLGQIDVLIDGPYIDSLNTGKGLRGSSNQQFHFLTDRLRYYPFEVCQRDIELVVSGTELTIVGIPTRQVLSAIHAAVNGYHPRSSGAVV